MWRRGKLLYTTLTVASGFAWVISETVILLSG